MLERGIGYAARTRWFIPFHTTFEELTATGNLALISSDTLRSALGAYHRQIVATDVEMVWMLDHFSANVERPLSQQLVLSDIYPQNHWIRVVAPSPFETDSSSYYGNRDLWNLLTIRLGMESEIIHRLEALRTTLGPALSITEEELSRRGITDG